MVLCLAVNPRDEWMIASGSKDKKIMLWTLREQKAIHEFVAHNSAVSF